MAKHEEFLKQVKELAEVHGYLYACDVLKLLAIIEKLKSQRDSWILGRDVEWSVMTSSLREQANKELDEIVGQG